MAGFRGLNIVIVSGYVAADPTTQATPNGKSVAKFSIPYNETWQGGSHTEWFNCVAWGKTAELVQNYVRKGSFLEITGSLRTNQWTDKDGGKRSKTEIIVNRLGFGPKVGGGNSQDADDEPDAKPVTGKRADGGDSNKYDDDSELPF